MGPLAGIRVVELASLAPGAFGAMILADLGADVLRVDRKSRNRGLDLPAGVLDRGRSTLSLDLKDSGDLATLHRIVESADVFVEGFRPGVAERLGLGPNDLMDRNPRLVYARMTGWGQDGPLAARAGHDINYLAVAGVLEPIGPKGHRPVPPLNLVADLGGGGMLMALGVLAALLERQSSGQGQVVDAAMVDGSSLLMTFIHGMRDVGLWPNGRGENLFDSGAPFYDTYECADGRFISVGAVETEFYDQLVTTLGLTEAPQQYDFSRWPELREQLAGAFKQRSRDEWAEIFADVDACVAPVLTPQEAPDHPHNNVRKAFIQVGTTKQPAPAPRFSRTPADPPRPLNTVDARTMLDSWAVDLP
ncbi:CaiB/BaiF CoA transferase family protein [Kibdelosporangium aridum]|uniref:Alpha-methylacyl-CoA racemase n=1 Tax=Kibdelosporangium aridum TaxID=2030 RepID=A0A1W2FRW0_KIBAR|nr:CaiB/BaiF CoA-transferase family protein [Kibdelosporangium aridum]SMD24603.1 alpha-methylacyl-CoA racemase [Kibdelosporangium aridum]